MLDDCETQMRYFKNPDHESHINIVQREIDVCVFHDIMKISMITPTLITWIRSTGYLLDYISIDFKNTKGLYLNCGALKNLPYEPNFVTDVTEGVKNLSLNESAPSTISAR